MSILCKLGVHRWRVHYVHRKEIRSSELLLLPFGFDVRAFVYPIEPTHLWPDGQRCKRCGKVRR